MSEEIKETKPKKKHKVGRTILKILGIILLIIVIVIAVLTIRHKIRSKRDRGVVVVTDPRLVTKNYGGSFRRSIPASVHTVTARDELLARVADFFS